MKLSITQKKRRKKMENKINIAEILRDMPKGTKLYSPMFDKYDDHTFGEEEVCTTDCFVKATDKQRVEFIEAAEKHYGGKYNPETLQVEPVKVVEPKCSFKPFDKVLVRDDGYGVWRGAHFSHYDSKREYPYVTTACGYKQCVSYEGNEYLLGTNKSPK